MTTSSEPDRRAHERRAREQKAIAIETYLRLEHPALASAEGVAGLTPAQRHDMALNAGVKPASDKTWKVVADFLGPAKGSNT